MEAEHQSYLRHFQRHARSVLTRNELEHLYKIFKEYQYHKHVEKLVIAIKPILSSNEKRELVLKIRLLIPRFHLDEFDRNIIRYGLATLKESVSSGSATIAVKPSDDNHRRHPPQRNAMSQATNTRVITLVKHESDDSLGFSVRGGSDHNLGIYVTDIDHDSPAEVSGLHVGDRIIEVNTINLASMSCETAAKVMNGAAKLKLLVEMTGKVPGVRYSRELTSWFDTDVKKIVRGDLENRSRSPVHDDPWPNSAERKINLTTHRKGEPLGFNIRGGGEFNLGIYVSRVDEDGLADRTGLRVGDQIISVNGTSFLDIAHNTATKLLRSARHLVLTVKATGRYPAYKELCTKYSWLHGKDNSKQAFHMPQIYSYDISGHSSFETKIEASTQTDDEDDSDARQPMTSSKIALDKSDQFILRSSSETNLSNVWPNYESHDRHGYSQEDLELEQMWSSVDDLLHDSKIQGRKRTQRSRSLKKKLLGIAPKSSDSGRPGEKFAKTQLNRQKETSGSMLKRGVFERSFGSQMMYQMSVEAAILVDLEDRCRRRLAADEAAAIMRHIKNYHTSGDITRLLNILHLLLDKPHKLIILHKIRDVIHPSHLSMFDKTAKTLKHPNNDNHYNSNDNSDIDSLPTDSDDETNAVLANFDEIYAEIETEQPVTGIYDDRLPLSVRNRNNPKRNRMATNGTHVHQSQALSTPPALTKPELEELYAIPWKSRLSNSSSKTIHSDTSSVSSIDSNPVAFDDLESPSQWVQTPGEKGHAMGVYELVASTVPSLRSIMRKYSIPNSENKNRSGKNRNSADFDSTDICDSSDDIQLPSSHITQQFDGNSVIYNQGYNSNMSLYENSENINSHVTQKTSFPDINSDVKNRSKFENNHEVSPKSNASSSRGRYDINVSSSHSSGSQIGQYNFLLGGADDEIASTSNIADVEIASTSNIADDLPQTISMLSMEKFNDDSFEGSSVRVMKSISQMSTLQRDVSQNDPNFWFRRKLMEDGVDSVYDDGNVNYDQNIDEHFKYLGNHDNSMADDNNFSDNLRNEYNDVSDNIDSTENISKDESPDLRTAQHNTVEERYYHEHIPDNNHQKIDDYDDKVRMTIPLLEMFEPRTNMMTIDITKVMSTLGISISGGNDSRYQKGVRVNEVIEGGSAHFDGRLKVSTSAFMSRLTDVDKSLQAQLLKMY